MEKIRERERERERERRREAIVIFHLYTNETKFEVS